jgi:hypothetical protein
MPFDSSSGRSSIVARPSGGKDVGWRASISRETLRHSHFAYNLGGSRIRYEAEKATTGQSWEAGDPRRLTRLRRGAAVEPTGSKQRVFYIPEQESI